MTSAIGGKIPSPPVKDTYDTAFRSLIEGILVSDHTKRPSVIQVRSRLEAMLAKQSETGAV